METSPNRKGNVPTYYNEPSSEKHGKGVILVCWVVIPKIQGLEEGALNACKKSKNSDLLAEQTQGEKE